ncbi:two-component sensor histidine kinase, partial [Escherichia coli]|nr:two-component sensor histidine kinase [Escherichia coli]
TFLIHRPDRPEPSDRWHTQLAAAAQLLGHAPASERPRLQADIVRAFPQLAISDLPDNSGALTDADPPSLHALRRLGAGYHVFSV